MKKLFVLTLIPYLGLSIFCDIKPALSASFSQTIYAQSRQDNYKNYYNNRFGYSISYPANILQPQGESTNGDGQRFVSKDGRAEMLVYGRLNFRVDGSGEYSLKELYNQTISNSNRNISYKSLGSNWFVVSGFENGRVFYEKTFLKNGNILTFYIAYERSQKSIYDGATAKISRSFKP